MWIVTVGVRQGCPLPAVLLNTLIFLENIMQKTLTPQHIFEYDCFAGNAVEDAEETGIPLLSVSIGGRPLCNLRFADNIDLLGGSIES